MYQRACMDWRGLLHEPWTECETDWGTNVVAISLESPLAVGSCHVGSREAFDTSESGPNSRRRGLVFAM